MFTVHARHEPSVIRLMLPSAGEAIRADAQLTIRPGDVAWGYSYAELREMGEGELTLEERPAAA